MNTGLTSTMQACTTASDHEPQPHQMEALAAVRTAFTAGQRRCLLHLAPAAGKTLIGRWIASEYGANLTLVVVPSLALVSQTLSEWRLTGPEFTAHIVCSDSTTAAGDRERTDGDVTAADWSRYRAHVTTDSSKLVRALRDRPGPTVIFSTYHSLPTVAEAVAILSVRVELMIADEAHHLAGRVRDEFAAALTDDHIPVARRVFMTATPVIVTDDDAHSMDDPQLFGHTVIRLDVAEAIRRNNLTVLIYRTPGDTTPDPVSALLTAATEGLSRVLTFHGRIAKAQAFAAAVDGAALPDGRTVHAYALSGADSAAHRVRVLDRLADCADNELIVVASAQCLTEGVNVPAVDGVMFADPKTSAVSAIQAVGRALRRHPGKQRGVVLLPVCVTDDVDADTALSTSAHRQVWRTLRALQSVDPQIIVDLRRSADGVGSERPAGRVEFRVPEPDRIAEIAVRAVDFTFRDWERWFTQLQQFVAEHGHATPPAHSKLGGWANRQRIARRSGVLDERKAHTLATLTGWVWDLTKHLWFEHLRQIRELCPNGIDVHDDTIMATRLRSKSPRRGVATVGHWLGDLRIAARAGGLDAWQQQCLDNTPGWREGEVNDDDAEGITLLGEYVAWKGHANPPHDFVDDDFPLGRWVNGLRRAKVTGLLPLPVRHELDVMIPRAGERRFHWHSDNVRWMLSLEALHQFVDREGHCRPTEGHVESLHDYDARIYEWSRAARHKRRTGELADHRIRLLDQVPGWVWDIPGPDEVVVDVGDRHGTRAGYAAGCHCGDCRAANREDSRRRANLIANGKRATDRVDAGRARTHIAMLRQQGLPLKAITRVTHLQRNTVTQIANGTTHRILPTTEQTILAVTAAQLREASAPGANVDATTTWIILDDLIARGWPKSWIARELGLKSLQFGRSTVVAATERKVADLDSRIGRRTPPPRPARSSLPTLDDIIASEHQAA